MAGDTKHKTTLWMLIFISIYFLMTALISYAQTDTVSQPNNPYTTEQVSSLTIGSFIHNLISFHTHYWVIDFMILAPVGTYLILAWAGSILPSGG